MRRVALTGGIATGKTHVARRLKARGVPVIDSDTIVHEALGAGAALTAAVAERFGSGVVAPDGSIDRHRLAAIVFRDPGARRELEALVHPHVYRTINEWFEALDAGTPLAVADIPLVFETGHTGDFDAVIVTACDPETQIRRVMHRDGATREEAERRLAAQWPIDRKVEQADYVIRTEGTVEDTDRQVDDVIEKLR